MADVEARRDAREWPSVSIVVPVLNEEQHLSEAVARLLRQEYDGSLDVVLALGPSRDATDEIARGLVAGDPRVRLVANPTGATPAGLNAAIAASAGEVVVRCDGHALLPHDYVRTAVEVLQRADADNVGGIMAAEGVTDFECAVARAMTTRLGVGGASFHVGGVEGEVPTVYLGVFRRSALERVGGYDESMVRAQDWEMNHRIRASGGRVWFTPDLRVTYRPRSTVAALSRQYREYGQWRRVVMRRHPETRKMPASLRYLAPPAMVVGVTAGTAAGLLGVVLGQRWLVGGLLAPAGYVALVGAGAVALGGGLGARSRAQLPVVFAVMHWSWGVGFLAGPRGRGGPGSAVAPAAPASVVAPDTIA